MRNAIIVSAAISLLVATACKKGGHTTSPSTPNDAAAQRLGCNHDVKVDHTLKHTWPYPAEYRNLRMTGRSQKTKLKVKPAHAAFVTATLSWKEGDIIEVRDSRIRVLKPRRMLVKRDVFVTRKEWSQGIEVEREYLVASKGEVGEFLFYNSQGMCLVNSENGPGWTACTLDDTFEGLSRERPHACQQTWWVKVERSRVDQGWMLVDPEVMRRVPPPESAPLPDAAR
jgi:hypothetical protein